MGTASLKLEGKEYLFFISIVNIEKLIFLSQTLLQNKLECWSLVNIFSQVLCLQKHQEPPQVGS